MEPVEGQCNLCSMNLGTGSYLYEDSLQVMSSCRGRIFSSDLGYISHFVPSRVTFKVVTNTRPVDISAQSDDLLSSITFSTLESRIKESTYLGGKDIHFSSGSEIIAHYFKKNTKINEFPLGTFFFGIHSNCIDKEYIFTAFPIGPSNTLQLRTNYNGTSEIIEIDGDESICTLRKIICEKVNLECRDLKIYETKTIRNLDTTFINEITSQVIFISSTLVTRCKNNSSQSGVIPLPDFSEIKMAEICNFACYFRDQIAICNQPCGHKISLDGFYMYLNQSNVPIEEYIVKNQDPLSKSQFEFVFLCPICKGGSSTLASFRVHPRLYKLAKHWISISIALGKGYIICKSSSHKGDIPIFLPKNKLSRSTTNVSNYKFVKIFIRTLETFSLQVYLIFLLYLDSYLFILG